MSKDSTLGPCLPLAPVKVAKNVRFKRVQSSNPSLVVPNTETDLSTFDPPFFNQIMTQESPDGKKFHVYQPRKHLSFVNQTRTASPEQPALETVP